MRSGEARAFRVMDAGVDTTTASIRRAFSHDVVRPPKYGADRAVPMHPRLFEIVREESAGKKPTDLLVVDDLGESPTRQKLYKAVIALQRRLGISPTWSYHRLRHAFGTHAVSGGANIEAVRELMGHRDLATTTRYVHAVARDKLAVIQALGGQPPGNGSGEGSLP
jgi:integrase